MTGKRRAAAVLEVFGVYLAGGVLVALAAHFLGVTIRNPLLSLTVGVTDSELLKVTLKLLALLALQSAGWFALAIPIDWWHRRRGLSSYGLTRANHSWRTLIVAGAVTAAVTAWPSVVVSLASARWKLGDTVPWRLAVFDMSWHRWQFWLFSAVGSWVVVPILEELFFRGYCQRRLAEDWGNGPAIIGTACLFVFSHGQYLRPDAYNIGMMLSVFAAALGYGVVFALTRSIVPSVVAHAVIDFPMTAQWQVVLLAVFVIGWAVSVRPARAAIKEIFAGASVPACIALAILGVAYPIASNRVPALAFVAMGMVLLAVALEATDKMRVGSGRPPAHVT